MSGFGLDAQQGVRSRVDETEAIARAQFARAEQDLQRFVADPGNPGFTSYGVTLEDLTRKLGEAERYLASVTTDSKAQRKILDVKIRPEDIQPPGSAIQGPTPGQRVDADLEMQRGRSLDDPRPQDHGPQLPYPPIYGAQQQQGPPVGFRPNKLDQPRGPMQGPEPSGPLPPHESPATIQDFQWPPPQFSPTLLTPPKTEDEAQAWLQQASQELQMYLAQVDAASMAHAAQQGTMDQYMLERMQALGQDDLGAQVQLAAELMPFVSSRTPQMGSLIEMTLTRAQGNETLLPEVTKQRVRLRGRQFFEGKIPSIRQGLDQTMRQSLYQEGMYGPMEPVLGGLQEGALGMQSSSVGERVMARVVRELDLKMAEQKANLLSMGMDTEEATKLVEDARGAELLNSLARADEQLTKAGLKENEVEEYLRHLASFVGFGGAMKIGSWAGRSALGALRAADRFANNPVAKLLDKMPLLKNTPSIVRAERIEKLAEAGGLAAWVYGAGLSSGQEVLIAQEPEDKRKDAETATRAVNATLAVAMLPILHYSNILGRVASLGSTKLIGKQMPRFIVESGIGMPIATELGSRSLQGIRTAIESAGNEKVNEWMTHTLLTFPNSAGAIERLFTSLAELNDNPYGGMAGVTKAAKDFAKEVGVVTPGMGVLVTLGMLRPSLLNRGMAMDARKEVRATMDPESAKAALKVIDEIEATMPEAKPTEKLAEAGPAEKEAARVLGERPLGDEIGVPIDSELARQLQAEPTPAKPVAEEAVAAPVPEKAVEPAKAEAPPTGRKRKSLTRKELAAAEEKAKTPEAIETVEKAKEAAKDRADAAALEKIAAKAKPEEAVKLRDIADAKIDRAEAIERGEVPPPVVEAKPTPQRRVRRRIREEQAAESRAIEAIERPAEILTEDAARRGEKVMSDAVVADAVERTTAKVDLGKEVERAYKNVMEDEASGVAPKLSTESRRKFAQMQVEKHFVESVETGDTLTSSLGDLTVVAKPHLNQGSVIVRVRGSDGNEHSFSVRQLIDMVATQKAQPRGKVKPKAEPKPEPEPKTPIEKARRAKKKKAEKLDTEAQKAVEEVHTAATPKARKKALEKVEELKADRRAEEAKELLVEMAPQGTAEKTGELPPQQKPSDTLVSRGPTDVNNLTDASALRAQIHAAKMVAELAQTGVLADIMVGKKPRKTQNPKAKSFLSFWEQTKHRYEGLPKEERVAEALRDYAYQGEGRTRPAQPITAIAKQIEKELQLILKMDPSTQAMEAFVLLHERWIPVLSGVDGVMMRFSPNGARLLNRLESTKFMLESGASQGGFVRTIPGGSYLYDRMRRVWPWMNPGWLLPSLNSMRFSANLVDELGRMFDKMPAGPPTKDQWFGRTREFVSNIWRSSLGFPEASYGRIARDFIMAQSRIFEEAGSMYHRSIGPHSENRKFLEAVEGRDERVFDAINSGEKSKAWKDLSPEEVRVASEVRDLYKKLWDLLEPVTRRGRHLRSELESVERQITVVEGRVKEEGERKANKREGLEMEAEGGPPIDLDAADFSGMAPRNMRRMLDGLKRRRKGILEQLADHKTPPIENYIHHVRQRVEGEMKTALDSLIDPNSGDRWHATATSVSTGAMLRRTGKLEASGELNRSVIASLSDYIPKAVAFYHRNTALLKWSDFLYGTTRPATFRDIARSIRDNRHSRYGIDGQDWAGHGFYMESPQGKLYERRIFDGKKWKANPEVPKGSRGIALFTDWAGRREPHMREQPPPPSLARLQAIQADGNFAVFRSNATRFARLAKAAKQVGKGKTKEGVDILWDAYSQGTDSPAFRALPEKVQNLLLEHASYLPAPSVRQRRIPIKLIEGIATIREGGFFERTSTRFGDDLRSYIDRFVGAAEELRIAFHKPEQALAAIGRFANAQKIGWYNPKTAVTVLTGGSFFTRTLPIHPVILAKADTHVFEALLRWRKWKKSGTSLVADQLKAIEPTRKAAVDPETPFRVGLDEIRTPKADLEKMSPEKRAEHELWDDAIVAAIGDPTFHGKIADIAHALTVDGDAPAGPVRKVGRFAKDIAVGNRGYGLIEKMEMFVRMEAFLATYVQQRKAGRNDAAATHAAQNMVIYSHGVFNQMTASAFFRTPLGPFLGGIKTYAARQFGIWLRSPAWMKGRYSGAAIALISAMRALGLGDATNLVGTSVSSMGAGPWLEEKLEEYAEEFAEFAEGNPLLESLEEFVVRPMALPFHFPTLGDSPGMALGKAAVDGAQGVQAWLSGDIAKAQRLGASAVRQVIPNTFTPLQKAFLTTPSQDAPGEFDYYPTFLSERPSYRLSQSGFMQLALDLAPGEQMGVTRQMESRRRSEARDRLMDRRKSEFRAELDALVRRGDEATARGVTEAEKEAHRADYKELMKQGAELGIPLDTPERRAAAVKEARQRNRIDAMGPVARSILSPRLSKTEKVYAFARALDEGLLGRKEAARISNELRGKQTFGEWAMGPEVAPETRQKMKRAFTAFMQRQN